VETAYLRLFERVGNSLGLSQRRLEVTIRGFPLACRRRGHPRDRLREAEDRPQRYRSRLDQLPRQRIQLARPRMLAEDDEALDHEREHPPGTHGVSLVAPR